MHWDCQVLKKALMLRQTSLAFVRLHVGDLRGVSCGPELQHSFSAFDFLILAFHRIVVCNALLLLLMRGNRGGFPLAASRDDLEGFG